MNGKTAYEQYLDKFTEAYWLQAVEKLLPEIHEVDRNAVQIWFRFYPLELHRYLENVEDKAKIVQRFVMQGDYELKNRIDSSHVFLYGHRFWKEIKTEIENRAENFNDAKDLSEEIAMIAEAVADKAKVNRSLTVGIAAVGLMTLAQVGAESFKNAEGATEKPKGRLAKSPDQIVAERAKDNSQGVLGFLRTVDKKFAVTYDEAQSDGRFQIINDEEIASASARDQSKDWRAMDERCWEGVVPVECRSASCGTCWIGVLAGEEKLSEVAELERRRMKIFGYNQPADAKPFLRLACQARGFGNATIVIPPWNGVFGKKVYDVESVELEPATTSAKKLREAVADVTNKSK